MIRKGLGAWLVCVSIAAAQDVTAPGASVEKVAGGYGLADGPVWKAPFLYFPDVKGESIHRFDPATGKASVWKEKFGRVSAMNIDPRGRIVAVDNGNQRIVRFEGENPSVIAAEEPAKPPRAPNDLTIDRQGNVYYTLSRDGVVRRATPDGKLSNAVEGVKSANGLIFSPDDKVLYVASHSERQIWAYDMAEGKGTNGRLFATLGEGPGGGADGMDVDERGNVYCCGQTDIWVFSPTGKLVQKIAVPEKPLVNMAFGDADGRTLYITAGPTLYRVKMQVKGGR
jgi:gluconolactonase